MSLLVVASMAPLGVSSSRSPRSLTTLSEADRTMSAARKRLSLRTSARTASSSRWPASAPSEVIASAAHAGANLDTASERPSQSSSVHRGPSSQSASAESTMSSAPMRRASSTRLAPCRLQKASRASSTLSTLPSPGRALSLGDPAPCRLPGAPARALAMGPAEYA